MSNDKVDEALEEGVWTIAKRIQSMDSGSTHDGKY
jgi:hypothetical protein